MGNCAECFWRDRTIRIESSAEDPGELQAQCDNSDLAEDVMGVSGLRGGVCIWTYEDAGCDYWKADDDDAGAFPP